MTQNPKYEELRSIILNYFDTYQISDDWVELVNSPRCMSLLSEVQMTTGDAHPSYYAVNWEGRSNPEVRFMTLDLYDLASWLTWDIQIKYLVTTKVLARWFAKAILENTDLAKGTLDTAREIGNIQQEVSYLSNLGEERTLKQLKDDLSYIQITANVTDDDEDIQRVANMYGKGEL